MKKTVSFNLEEDIIERIESYKKDNNLSSRSSALERMILLQNNPWNKDDLRAMIKELVNEMNFDIIEPEKMDNKLDEISMSITDSFDNIPD